MHQIKTRKLEFAPRRAVYVDVRDLLSDPDHDSEKNLVENLEIHDLIYRTLCSVLFNFVPTSGHPGGSISSGRIVQGLFYETADYNIGNPDDDTADIISYAAGHKALGLYALLALRNELCLQFRSDLLPSDIREQLRLEDLLGFRRNPTQETPLFAEHKAKPLDGHPTPLVPFVRLATGASGVGMPASFGLAMGARDYFGKNAPLVHVIEGEGGITPGRTQEAMAAAATAQVNNIVLHLDWNQASIDSDRVCAEDGKPGDYVQWNPLEYAYCHDWNVIWVPNGFDFRQILAAQRMAASRPNDQPTCIVYRTIKGWQYGIEGRTSHGAGHNFCSDGFHETLKTFEEHFGLTFPRVTGEISPVDSEKLYFKYLLTVRQALRASGETVKALGTQLKASAERLQARSRSPRPGAPQVRRLYGFRPDEIPAEVLVDPGKKDALRSSLGRTLNYLNRASAGAIVASSADLFDSTSISKINEGFTGGFWNAGTNPESRLFALGGICEDCMGATMSGISAFGKAIGAASSYGAFIAALQHISARLHCIGQQARQDYNGEARNPYLLICAHAGLKTGEDGPTHADPQPLQLLQENFPGEALITLTPWDPNEVWPLVVAALNRRPAVIAPFVTRPNETIFDRRALNIPPVAAAAKGIYAIRSGAKDSNGSNGAVILQGSCVMNEFVSEVLPQIDGEKLGLDIFYVSSSELFDSLARHEQEEILPLKARHQAMAITGFTLPTMYRWLLSEEGRECSLYPFRNGRFPGSGQAHKVLEEAGLDGESQWHAVSNYARAMSLTMRRTNPGTAPGCAT